MKNRPLRFLLTAMAGLLTGIFMIGAAPTDIKSEQIYTRSARLLARGLPQAHLTHRELSDTIAQKALDSLLDTLDHDHTLFLTSDVEAFRAKVTDLDDELRRGNTDFAFEIFERYRSRIRDRCAYVKELLDQGFDFSPTETYEIDREHMPRASNEAEWNDIWRRKIKHDLLSRKVAREIEIEFPEKEDKLAPEDLAAESVDSSEEVIPAKPRPTPEEEILKRYQQMLEIIDGHDEEFILQTYLNAFTRAYDAHSAFLSPRANEDFDISMKLSLTGIGALLTLNEGAAEVVRLIPGGPAEHDGRLQAGDKIIAVAQEGEEPVDIMHWPLYKSVRLIRGEVGSKVTLHIIPASDRTESIVKKIELVRDEIKLEEREAKAEVREIPREDGEGVCRIGLITLPEFYADLSAVRAHADEAKRSATDIRRLLEEMNEEKVDGILLDLRNNGGGSLSDAIEMTGYFIDKGPVVQVKANRRVQVKRDPNPGVVYDGPLVVLVNRQSASASEILSGALQDYGRAIIVGDTKTHGKGSVQSVFALDPDSPELGALKITTAGFYRIDGRSTQLEGVRPDIVVPSAMDVMEIGEEYLPNVLPWSWVASSDYDRVQDTAPLVESLRERSSKRLQTNEQYGVYSQLMERLRSKIAMDRMPLDYESRLAMAREDYELQALQDQISDSMNPDGKDDSGEENKKHEDIILDEALLILRDLVDAPVHS